MRILLATTLLLLAACHAEEHSGVPPTKAAATYGAANVSACELISDQDLKRVTGLDFKNGMTTVRDSTLTRCRFDLTNGPGGGVTIGVHLHQDSIDLYKPGAQPISGVGDEAYWSEERRTFAARRADRVIVATGDSLQERTGREIVAKALERM